MPRYRIEGVNRETGRPVPSFVIDAENEAGARARAAERGVRATGVEPWSDAGPRFPELRFLLAFPFLLFTLLTAVLLGGLPGAGVGALLAWLKVVDASIGVAAGAGLGIGAILAFLVLIFLIARPDRKPKP